MTISRDELRALLVECQIVPFSADELGDDTPIVIDSFALVWLIQMLQERHGIVLDPTDEEVAAFDSVRAVHAHLTAARPVQGRAR